jgi:hypothetical protein
MTEAARGIHAHPSRKLGLRKALPDKRALMLRDVLTGALPEHPATVDYLAGITFGMYNNDRWGDCGPTMIANNRRMVTYDLLGVMQAPSQDDVTDLYVRSTTPPFNPLTGENDNGVYLQEMLDQVHSGGIGGIRCVAFAKIDPGDQETLRAATAIFGAVLYGVDLQVAQQRQTDAGTWDYSPSGEWGGHAVPGGAYRAGRLKVITWAEAVEMTDTFVSHQVDEAWVAIWPEHFGSKAFLQGVNVSALAAAYTDVTGDPLPIPPSPAPPTPPTPGPGAGFPVDLDPDVGPHVRRLAQARGISDSAWVNNRLRKYFD